MRVGIRLAHEQAELTVAGGPDLLEPLECTSPCHAGVDNIEVRMPTTEEAELMHLPAGTPVGQHARIGIDETGRRVRVLVQTWAGDRQVITYGFEVPERRLPGDGGTA